MKNLINFILLLAVVAATSCKKQEDSNKIKPVPEDLIKYFAFYKDTCSFYYVDTNSRNRDTIIMQSVTAATDSASREQYFQVKGTGLIGGVDFICEVRTNAVIIRQAKNPLAEPYLQLIYNEGVFKNSKFATDVFIFPELKISGKTYKNVMQYSWYGYYIHDMWFAPYVGLIQIRKGADLFAIEHIDTK